MLAGLPGRFIVFAHRLVIGLSHPNSSQRFIVGILAAYWAIWTV